MLNEEIGTEMKLFANENNILGNMREDKAGNKSLIPLQEQRVGLKKKKKGREQGALEYDDTEAEDEDFEMGEYLFNGAEPRELRSESLSFTEITEDSEDQRPRKRRMMYTNLASRHPSRSAKGSGPTKGMENDEVLELLRRSEAAKANALEVRRSFDNNFEKLNRVLAKWTDGQSVQISVVEDVYMSDIYVLQKLAAESQKVKSAIEAADKKEVAAEKKLQNAIVKSERQ